MLFRPEKVPLLLKAKEKAFAGAFVGLALLVSGGWIYLLVFHALAVRGMVFFLNPRRDILGRGDMPILMAQTCTIFLENDKILGAQNHDVVTR